MKRLTLYLVLSCLAVFSLTGCKRTVEGESKRWISANSTVDELGALYPGFKGALEEQRQKAKAAMDAAEKVADEKQRIEQMAAANGLLTGGFVGQLRDADKAKKEISKKALDVAGAVVDELDRRSARQAAEQAMRVLAEVEVTLRRGAPDVIEAGVQLQKVTGDLRVAEQNLDRVLKVARDKQRAKQAAEKQAQTPAAGQAPGAGSDNPPAPATWTCEYCGTANQGDATTCHNCGAARPHDHK